MHPLRRAAVRRGGERGGPGAACVGEPGVRGVLALELVERPDARPVGHRAPRCGVRRGAPRRGARAGSGRASRRRVRPRARGRRGRACPWRYGTIDQGHGYPRPGAPTRRGTGTGSGKVAARGASAARRGCPRRPSLGAAGGPAAPRPTATGSCPTPRRGSRPARTGRGAGRRPGGHERGVDVVLGGRHPHRPTVRCAKVRPRRGASRENCET